MSKDNKKIIKIIKPMDFLIIFFVLFIASISIISMIYYKNSDDITAVIKYDGELMHSFDLNKVNKPIEVTVGKDLKVDVLIEKDGVTVVNSQCDDKLCMACGKLTNASQVAICLPARVTVELINKESNRLDAIVR